MRTRRAEPALSKVEHADRRSKELRALIGDYLDTKPFETSVRQVEGWNEVFMSRCDPVPAEVSFVAGDVVHSLRAALDHLVWQLVENNGHTPDRRTQFPIGSDVHAIPTGWAKTVKQSMVGAPADAVRVMRSLTPFKAPAAADHDLWMLHQLDVIDKHRTLLVTQASNRAVVIGVREPSEEIYAELRQSPRNEGKSASEIEAELTRFRTALHEMELPLRPAERAITVGTAIVRVPTEDNGGHYVRKLVFTVAINEPGVVDAEDVLETLDRLAASVRATITLFEAYL